MKRNNKALYEKIMRNVSIQVKRALNENKSFSGDVINNAVNIVNPVKNLLEGTEKVSSLIENDPMLIGTEPCIILTLKVFDNKKFLNNINNDKYNDVLFKKQKLGYCFLTESNMAAFVFMVNKIEQTLLLQMVLKIVADALYNTYDDIEYDVYYGVYTYDEYTMRQMNADLDNLHYSYVLSDAIKSIKGAHTMDDNYLTFVKVTDNMVLKEIMDAVKHVNEL